MTKLKYVLICIGMAVLSLLGCALLQGGAKSPRVERFECQVRALEPLVDDMLDARKLVEDLYAGRASMQAVLANLNATAGEMVELQMALAACEPAPVVELPEGVVELPEGTPL